MAPKKTKRTATGRGRAKKTVKPEINLEQDQIEDTQHAIKDQIADTEIENQPTENDTQIEDTQIEDTQIEDQIADQLDTVDTVVDQLDDNTVDETDTVEEKPTKKTAKRTKKTTPAKKSTSTSVTKTYTLNLTGFQPPVTADNLPRKGTGKYTGDQPIVAAKRFFPQYARKIGGSACDVTFVLVDPEGNTFKFHGARTLKPGSTDSYENVVRSV